MRKNELKIIYLNCQVDDILRSGFWATGDQQAAYKDLFKIGKHYFIYQFNRNGQVNTSSLRQIPKTEYWEKRNSMLAERPRRGCENWKDKDGNHELKHYIRYMWKKKLPAQSCTFFNDADETNQLLKCYQKAVKETKTGFSKEESKEHKEKKAKIRQAVALKDELHIAYDNIVAIGLEKSSLLEFKESYKHAMTLVKDMSPAERYQTYIELRPDKSRTSRKNVIEKLGIKFFGADVYRLNLSELEKLLHDYVQKYKNESVQTAIQTAINMPYDEREKLYESIHSLSRTEKREILKKLGVDINAIGLNQYSLVPIKSAIAASLGIEVEKNG